MNPIDEALAKAASFRIPTTVIHLSLLMSGDKSEFDRFQRVLLIGDGDAKRATKRVLNEFGISCVDAKGLDESIETIGSLDLAVTVDPLYPANDKANSLPGDYERRYGLKVYSIHEMSSGYAFGAERISDEAEAIRHAWNHLDDSGRNELLKLVNALSTPYSLGMNAVEANYGRLSGSPAHYPARDREDQRGGGAFGKGKRARGALCLIALRPLDYSDDIIVNASSYNDVYCFAPDKDIRFWLREHLDAPNALFFKNLPYELGHYGSVPCCGFGIGESPLLQPMGKPKKLDSGNISLADIAAASNERHNECFLRLHGFDSAKLEALGVNMLSPWTHIEISGFDDPCEIWRMLRVFEAIEGRFTISLRRFPHFDMTCGYVVTADSADAK